MKKTAGMILCGGMGKRLRPLTEEIPKPLIKIQDNYTIMDKQLAEFKNAGVDQILLLTGFLGDKIRQRYGDDYLGLQIDFLEEDFSTPHLDDTVRVKDYYLRTKVIA